MKKRYYKNFLFWIKDFSNAKHMQIQKISILSELKFFVFCIFLFLISYIFDKQVYLFFKNVKFVFFDLTLSVITNFGIVVLFILLIPSIMIYIKNKKLVYLLFLTFIISFLLSFIIKLIVLRHRPTDALTYSLTNIVSYSFPSTHSMVVFSLLPILLKVLPKQKIFWICFAFLVAFSRIYFSFHFLSDVVFGALFGYFIGNIFLDLYDNGILWKK